MEERREWAPGRDCELFTPASWQTKIDFINHLIHCNNVLIAILADQNAGKTSFLTLLQSNLKAQIKTFTFRASSLFNSAELMEQFCDFLAIEKHSKLADIISMCQEKEMHVMLMIDDAHHLPIKWLEELLQGLQLQEENAFFHVCIASNYSLFRTLKKFAQEKYHDLIHSLELGPLNEDETRTYLNKHLVAYPEHEKLLTDSRVKQFFQLTEGNIVGINTQMEGFFGKAAKKIKRKNQTILAGGFLAGLALVFAGVDYFVHPLMSGKELSEGTFDLVLDTPPAEVTTPSAPPPVAILESEIPAYALAAIRREVRPALIKKADLFEPNPQAPQEFEPVLDKVVVIPTPTPVTTVAKVTTAIVQKPEKKTAWASKQLAIKGEDSLVMSKHATNKARYTIQLMASLKQKTLDRYVVLHHLQGKTKLLLTKKDGVDWYVLAYGEFADHQTAKQAINHLPRSLSENRPWIRLINDLKEIG